MKINTSLCRMLYENLHSTVLVPLKIDVVPEWCITFKLTRNKDSFGWIEPEDYDDGFQCYEMEISTVQNKTYKDLMETILHEMLHIALESKGEKNWEDHSIDSPFDKLKNKVEAYTGLSIS